MGAPTAETVPPPAPSASGEIVYMLARFEGKFESRLDEMKRALATLADRVFDLDKKTTATGEIANEAKRIADEANHLREQTDEATRRRFDEGMSAMRAEVSLLRDNDKLQNAEIARGIKATEAQNPKIDQLVEESAERKALSKARVQIELEAAADRKLRKEKLETLAKRAGFVVILLNIAGWFLTHLPHGTP
jgi:hypothetical protein